MSEIGEGIPILTQPKPVESLRPNSEATVISEDTKNPWVTLAPKKATEATSPRQEPRSRRGLRKETSPGVTMAMQQYKEDLKRREELGKAVFEVRIDKAKLAQVKIPDRQRNRHKLGDREIDAERDADQAQGQRELQALMDRMQRLPEKLQFQPGITLIVGENGAGKSTLAKALFLQAKYQQSLQRDRQLTIGDPERFSEAEANAYRSVFEPSQGAVYERVWLNQAGLAPDIARALMVDNFHSAVQSGDYIEYTDFPEVIGSRSNSEVGYAFADPYGTGSSGWEDHRSHRQTVDSLVFGELGRKKEWNPNPKVYFFDEPETGMSPRRHRQLENEIAANTTNGSIIVVPTNSVVLFDSDHPRIDLDFPERGIHKPSQYPEAK